tara:strand:- start:2982 stop:5306 length:2325 start_codon:yes stop_codon:yes gene_type:complete
VTTHRSARYLFLALLLAMAWCAAQVARHDLPLQSDLLALLPDSPQQPATRQAAQSLARHLGDDFVIFIGGARRQDALQAANTALAALRDTQNLQVLDAGDQASAWLHYLRSLLEHRAHLLCTACGADLADPAQRQALLREAIARAYDLGALAAPYSPLEDPLGLLQEFADAQQLPGAAVTTTGELPLIETADRTWAIIHGRAQPGSFSLDAQAAMQAFESATLAGLAQGPAELQVLRAGAIFHAARAAADARREMALIGLGSSLGIALLFFASFRSLTPLLLSLSSIAFGCCAALLLTWVTFGSLHLLTLVFGASLIGVAVDYSLHYLTRGRAQRGPVPGLPLAILTSAVGYGSLLQAQLPGLQEMAVFSIVGLVASGLYVMVVLPRCRYRGAAAPDRLLRLAGLPWILWRASPWFAVAPAAAVVAGLASLHASSDVRVLHTPDAKLVAQQAQIESLFPGWAPNQFFLIEGDSVEAMLQAAEAFRPRLQRLRDAGAIGGYLLLSDALPSLQRQAQTRELLLGTVYAPGGEAQRLLASLGYPQQAQAAWLRALADSTPLQAAAWLQRAPAQQRLAWLGAIDGRYYSLVLLRGIRATQPLADEAGGAVRFVDTVAAMSTNLSERAASALQLLAVAYLGVAALLLARYRRADALRLLLVPLGGSLAALAALGLLGTPVTLFHVFALYLLLGLGMDYGIFLRESRQETTACRLAIMLSVLTSSLSFGLLSLSSTSMISAFGLTVMLGALGNWLLSPLALRGRGRPQRGQGQGVVQDTL